MLRLEFREFYTAWRQKANEYVADANIRSVFDRFFTLYVVYNRLYVELTFEKARAGEIVLANRDRFPDAAAAKDYVRQRIGCRKLMAALDGSHESAEAIAAASALLAGPVNGTTFHINLDRVTGNWQPEEDAHHLGLFRSTNVNDRALAVLQFIYAVRCNLFHGHKSFEGVQAEVIQPANVLLLHVIDILFQELDRP